MRKIKWNDFSLYNQTTKDGPNSNGRAGYQILWDAELRRSQMLRLLFLFWFVRFFTLRSSITRRYLTSSEEESGDPKRTVALACQSFVFSWKKIQFNASGIRRKELFCAIFSDTSACIKIEKTLGSSTCDEKLLNDTSDLIASILNLPRFETTMRNDLRQIGFSEAKWNKTRKNMISSKLYSQQLLICYAWTLSRCLNIPQIS